MSSSYTDDGGGRSYPIRASRGMLKRKAWTMVFDFLENSHVPDEPQEEFLLQAVEECREWKRYIEQDLDEGDVLTESSDRKVVDEEVEILVPKELEEFKIEGKFWVESGLIQKPHSENDRARFQFPLPEGDGLRRLNTIENFKLPYGVYAPTVDNERIVYEWKYNLKKNQWIAEHDTKKKRQTVPTCYCANRQGSHCGPECINRSIQCECSYYNCSFGHNDCGNRLFANWMDALNNNDKFAQGFEVRPTEMKGLGLFSVRSYNTGSLIVEYTGEIIDLEEVDRRLSTVYKDETKYYFLGLEKSLVIDAGRRGSVARFVNHSCDPNCEMQKWYVDNVPRIGLFAKRPIYPGEEITYDYNFEWYENSEPQKCYCNSRICRGIIGKRPEPQLLIMPPPPKKTNAVEDTPKPKKSNQKKSKKPLKNFGVEDLGDDDGDMSFNDDDEDDGEDEEAEVQKEPLDEESVEELEEEHVDQPLRSPRKGSQNATSPAAESAPSPSKTDVSQSRTSRRSLLSTVYDVTMNDKLKKELGIDMRKPGIQTDELKSVSKTKKDLVREDTLTTGTKKSKDLKVTESRKKITQSAKKSSSLPAATTTSAKSSESHSKKRRAGIIREEESDEEDVQPLRKKIASHATSSVSPSVESRPSAMKLREQRKKTKKIRPSVAGTRRTRAAKESPKPVNASKTTAYEASRDIFKLKKSKRTNYIGRVPNSAPPPPPEPAQDKYYNDQPDQFYDAQEYTPSEYQGAGAGQGYSKWNGFYQSGQGYGQGQRYPYNGKDTYQQQGQHQQQGKYQQGFPQNYNSGDPRLAAVQQQQQQPPAPQSQNGMYHDEQYAQGGYGQYQQSAQYAEGYHQNPYNANGIPDTSIGATPMSPVLASPSKPVDPRTRR